MKKKFSDLFEGTGIAGRIKSDRIDKITISVHKSKSKTRSNPVQAINLGENVCRKVGFNNSDKVTMFFDKTKYNKEIFILIYIALVDEDNLDENYSHNLHYRDSKAQIMKQRKRGKKTFPLMFSKTLLEENLISDCFVESISTETFENKEDGYGIVATFRANDLIESFVDKVEYAK